MLPFESNDPAHDRPRGSAWLILARGRIGRTRCSATRARRSSWSTATSASCASSSASGLASPIVGVPPAGPDALATAAVERSRRPALRLVLLNDPADVAGRLHALEQGFDDALPSTIAAHELAGRSRGSWPGPASGRRAA